MPNFGGSFQIFNSDANDIEYYENEFTQGNENVIFWLNVADRGNTDNYPPFVARDSNNVSFENNIINLTQTNRKAFLIDNIKAARVAPYYEYYTGKNILIGTNEYNIEPRYQLALTTYILVTGLTNIQAIEDSLNVPFGWEDGSVVV